MSIKGEILQAATELEIRMSVLKKTITETSDIPPSLFDGSMATAEKMLNLANVNFLSNGSGDWISVSDEMPEPEEPVLITRKNRSYKAPNFMRVLLCAIDPESGEWYDFQSDEQDIESEDWIVTHWQPLPKPAENNLAGDY